MSFRTVLEGKAASVLETVRNKRQEQSERENTRGRGRGSYIDYYGDLGFSTTAAAHDKWGKEEALYQKQKAEDMSIINKNKSLIAKAQKEYDNYRFVAPNIEKEAEKSYWENNKNLLPIRVVDIVGGRDKTYLTNPDTDAIGLSEAKKPEYGKWGEILSDPKRYRIEATYYLPEEALKKMQGIRTYTGADGSLLVSTKSKGPNKTVGQELHDAFRDAQDEYAAKYKTEATRQMSNAINQQRSAFDASKQQYLDQLTQARADTQAAEERIQGNQQLRIDQLNKLRQTYQNRLDTMRSIFSGTAK